MNENDNEPGIKDDNGNNSGCHHEVRAAAATLTMAVPHAYSRLDLSTGLGPWKALTGTGRINVYYDACLTEEEAEARRSHLSRVICPTRSGIVGNWTRFWLTCM